MHLPLVSDKAELDVPSALLLTNSSDADVGYAVECIRIADAATLHNIPRKFIASLKYPERVRATPLKPGSTCGGRLRWSGVAKVQMDALAEEVRLIRRYKQEKDIGLVAAAEPVFAQIDPVDKKPAVKGKDKGKGKARDGPANKTAASGDKKCPSGSAAPKVQKTKAATDVKDEASCSRSEPPTPTKKKMTATNASAGPKKDLLEDYSEDRAIKRGVAGWGDREPSRKEILETFTDMLLTADAKEKRPGERREPVICTADDLLDYAITTRFDLVF